MQKQSHDNVILELTVRNHPGVMTHVCGLFARRAYSAAKHLIPICISFDTDKK